MRLKLEFIAGLLALVTGVATAGASSSPIVDGLRLSVTPLKEKLTLGEPVALSLVFANESQKVIRLPGPAHQVPGVGHVGVRFRHESGTEYSHLKAFHQFLVPGSEHYVIQPDSHAVAIHVFGASYVGKSQDSRRSLDGCEWYCLDLPLVGNYEIEVTYKPVSEEPNWGGQLVVHGVRVSVVAPQGSDQIAYPIWLEAARWGFKSWAQREYVHHWKVAEILGPALVGSLANTVYEPYAKYMYAFAQYELGEMLVLLERYAPELDGFVLQEEMMFDIVDARRRLHQDSEAQRLAARRKGPRNVRGLEIER